MIFKRAPIELQQKPPPIPKFDQSDSNQIVYLIFQLPAEKRVKNLQIYVFSSFFSFFSFFSFLRPTEIAI